MKAPSRLRRGHLMEFVFSQNENGIASTSGRRECGGANGLEASKGDQDADRPDDRPGERAVPPEGGAARRRRRSGRGGRLHLDLGAAGPRGLRRLHRDHAHGAGDRADRARDRGPADPDPSSDRHGPGGAVEPGGVRGPLHARPGHVAPLDHRGHARPPVRAAGPPDAQLPGSPERGPARPGLGGRRERRVPRAQPDRRHGLGPDPGAARGPRPGDAPPRRRARVGDDPVDGRRARRRGARRPAHHEGRGRGRQARSAGRRRGPGRALPATTKWTPRGRGRTRCSGRPSTARTTSDCSIAATPPTWATSSRRGTSRPSSIGCAPSATRGPPISRSASSPFGPDREARIESRKRTLAFLASLCPEL